MVGGAASRDILKILTSGDLVAEQHLARAAEETSRRESYGQVFDDWEGEHALYPMQFDDDGSSAVEWH